MTFGSVIHTDLITDTSHERHKQQNEFEGVTVHQPKFAFIFLKFHETQEWLCKLILCIKMYSSLASINWMFIEGLMLHGRVTTKIFEQKFPFKVYYLIGWGELRYAIISSTV